MIIGVTGKIGSGKSTAAHYIADKYGFALIEADDVAKGLYDDDEVLGWLEFNIPHVVTNRAQREIDRSFLRKKLFTNPELNKRFIAFVWPKIIGWINEMIKNQPEKNFVIEILSFAYMEEKITDIIFFLHLKNEEELIRRVVERDNRDTQETKQIVDFQEIFVPKDDEGGHIVFIENDGNVADLKQYIDQYLNQYQLAENKK